jgi:Glu-tRNA(Gln) amidotransferase subunit E-like FAD-binding protein
LLNAGDQVPIIPLFEVVGKAAKASPEQIGVIALNVGVIFGSTLIVKFVVVAHNPFNGVKRYVVVTVLFKDGVQVPVIPLVEFDGNAAKTAPEHIVGIALNVGVIIGLTVMDKLAVVAHCPVVGVNK